MHVDSWRTTYRDVLPQDRLAALSYSQREQGWTERLERAGEQRSVTFVAEDQDGQVVGFSTAGPGTSGDAIYDDVAVAECAYAWDDIRTLVDTTRSTTPPDR